MEAESLEQQIAGLAVLGEPVRRSLYLYVAGQGGEVSRDDAARAVGVSRTLAGFHLDRLAEAGLLEISFRRLSGRSGPGAGRPSKLYRRAARQLAVSLPPRRYELAARILAEAVVRNTAAPAGSALAATACAVGRSIGERARTPAARRRSRKRRVEDARAQLVTLGYEPVRDADEIRLRNCPFHALVSEHRSLVCGMNLALIEGVIEGLALDGVQPVLDPKPGMCCVALRLAP